MPADATPRIEPAGRALGRTTLPGWLKERQVEGTIQIDRLALDGARLNAVRSRLEWDAGHVEFGNFEAMLAHAAIKGRLAVNLSGSLPAYRFTGQVKNLPWQSGGLDAEGSLTSSGIGAQLVANLASTGTFSGTALDFGAPRLAAPPATIAWRGRAAFRSSNSPGSTCAPPTKSTAAAAPPRTMGSC